MPVTRGCSPRRSATTCSPPRWASRRASAASSSSARRTAHSPGSCRAPGPTVAFLAEDADSALELQIALSAARLNAVHVHGPVHGARIMH